MTRLGTLRMVVEAKKEAAVSQTIWRKKSNSLLVAIWELVATSITRAKTLLSSACTLRAAQSLQPCSTSSNYQPIMARATTRRQLAASWRRAAGSRPPRPANQSSLWAPPRKPPLRWPSRARMLQLASDSPMRKKKVERTSTINTITVATR